MTFAIENVGKVYGGDVSITFSIFATQAKRFAPQIPQLYVNFPVSSGEPPSVLKGFTNVEVHPGQKVVATITLSRHDLSIWNVLDQGWRKPKGIIRLAIGASSRDIRLKGELP